MDAYAVSQYTLDNYIPVPESGCWLWLGCWNENGYGRVQLKNGPVFSTGAHRVFYTNHIGPIPSGLLVCHKCDTPSCVNPEHLFLGTNADNMLDRDIKGRAARPEGEKGPAAKLTEEQVRVIRASQEQQRVLARRYGVSDTAIKFVRRRITWRNVA